MPTLDQIHWHIAKAKSKCDEAAHDLEKVHWSDSTHDIALNLHHSIEELIRAVEHLANKVEVLHGEHD